MSSAKAEDYDDHQAPPPNPPPQAPAPHMSYELGRQWTETIFPMKLYDILCNPEYHHAISWMPHGRSWKVLNKDFFMEEICPQYFAQTRYESFIRQVNGWGFKRMRREGPDRSSYYHEHFLRGYPNLIDHMRRPAPGEKSRDLREEPDFFQMNPMPPLPSVRDVGGRPPNGGGATKKAAGRPLGSSNPGMGTPRAHSSFETVTPRSDGMMPPAGAASAAGAPPYPYGMPPGSPWAPGAPPQWPAYPGYPPQAGYWAQPPPPHMHSPYRPGYPSYPPMPGWPQAPPGQAMVPYGYPMYDPSGYYGAYPAAAGAQPQPPTPSTPQTGGGGSSQASASGSKRARDDGDQSQDDLEGSSTKRSHSAGHGPPSHVASAGSEGQYPPVQAGMPPGMHPSMMYPPMYPPHMNPAMMQQPQDGQGYQSAGGAAAFSPIRPGHIPGPHDAPQQHSQQPPQSHRPPHGQGHRAQPGADEYDAYNHPPGSGGAGAYGRYGERNL